jgi:hypothetical protein
MATVVHIAAACVGFARQKSLQSGHRRKQAIGFSTWCLRANLEHVKFLFANIWSLR